MKIIYTEKHNLHAPPYQFEADRLAPYSESPERAERILRALRDDGFTDIYPPRVYSSGPILAVHDADYLHFLEHIYSAWAAHGGPESGVVPDTFAVRPLGRKPADLLKRPGYYCFDAQTPIVEKTWEAALASAWCALTGADLILSGESAVYALCRPPGHHAGRDLYGGYCYLNNAAIAAVRLMTQGRVAILDIDYHHGNGTQSIFYDSSQVFFISLHADPDRQYPFYSGFADEQGTGKGLGFNRNFPLEPMVDGDRYLAVLEQAMAHIAEFSPEYLIVSAGTDTYQNDPLSDLNLPAGAFSRIGERIARAGLPTLLVQEGGYNVEELGTCAVNLLRGFGENSA